MRLPAETMTDVLNRLRRVEGQIRGIIAMLESGREPAELVQQLASASRALHKARMRIVAHAVEECVAAQGHDESQRDCLERMEQLFLSPV